MSDKGKRLLAMAAVSMAIIFVVLYAVSGSRGGAPQTVRRPEAPPAVSAEAGDVLPLEDAAYEPHRRPLPPVTLSRKLQDMASSKYISNRLGEAIRLWRLSVYLNERNNLSTRRLHDVTEQLNTIVQEMIALGNHDYAYLRYKRAIYHWEKVLNLVHDKDSPVYLKTLQKIAMARRKLNR